jgi:hypothetical protein
MEWKENATRVVYYTYIVALTKMIQILSKHD